MDIWLAISEISQLAEECPLQVGVVIKLYLPPIPLQPTLMCAHACAHTHTLNSWPAGQAAGETMIQAAAATVVQGLKQQHLSEEQIAPHIIQLPIFGERTRTGRPAPIYK